MSGNNQPDSKTLAIQPDVVRELWEIDGSGEFFREVCTLFLTAIPGQLAQLRSSLSQNDAKAISKLSHQLKSSSGNLGAMAFSRACAEIEEAAIAGKLDSMPARLDFLDAELVRVKSSLEAHQLKAA